MSDTFIQGNIDSVAIVGITNSEENTQNSINIDVVSSTNPVVLENEAREVSKNKH